MKLVEMKRCTRCGEEKPATHEYFGKKAAAKDGFNWWCKECTCKHSRNYHKRNREKALASAREWKRNNKERIREYKKAYELANLEKHKRENSIRGCRWAKKHPEKVRKRTAIYRARKRKVVSTFTIAQWKQCKEHFKSTCAYCGRTMKRLEQEHFIPLSSGGPYTVNNIIPACKSCNSSKCDSDFFDWYPRQKFYSKAREAKILKYLNYINPEAQQASIFEIEGVVL